MKYIIGLSGGCDSCYTLHLCKDMDLIAVTFSNGWDTKIAGENAKRMCDKLGIQHRTYSCDLYEFREIQRAFLLASTPHSECPSDVAIKKSLLNAIDDYKAVRIISGSNRLEGDPPANWSVVDGLYVKDIMKKYGRVELRTFPNMTLHDHFRFRRLLLTPLNEDTFEYNSAEAKQLLIDRYGWQDYGVKHYESVFTKFNQGLRYYKFGIDLRTIEVEHDYDLSKPPFPREEFNEMGQEICNKLDLSFNAIMIADPIMDWEQHKSYRKWILRYKKLMAA